MRTVWNVLALCGFVIGGLFGYAAVLTHAWLLLAASFPLLAAGSWGFFQRRYKAWRTVTGWTYTGLSFGLLGGIAHVVHPMWFCVLMLLLSAVGLLALPNAFNKLFWTARLLRVKPAGWSDPEAVPRETVLATSPFTLHEITKVTEQRSGNVVQEQERKLDRRELRFQGEPVESDESLAALEDWILARYRQYRSLRRLPLAVDVGGEQTVTREEDQQLDLYTTPLWKSSNGILSLNDVLLSSPFQVWIKFLQDNTLYEVKYRSEPRFERHFIFVHGYEEVNLTAEDLQVSGQVTEEVTLKLGSTGRTLGFYPDLTSAEAEIYARYRAQHHDASRLNRSVH